jgi:hypothetical protein
MTRERVVALMNSSKTRLEWNQNKEEVKAAFGGDYPEFFWDAVILSDVLWNAQVRFGEM